MEFPFLFSVLLLALPFFVKNEAERNMGTAMDNKVKGRIGAIVDESSRIGKEESLAMEMAVEDFTSFSTQSFSLLIRDSKSDPNQAVLAAKDLINVKQVQVLIGPQTWEEASLVAELGSRNHIPVLSLADEMPEWATERLEFLVQASSSKFNQMKAIAAVIRSWDWHLVNVIYEEKYFSTTGIFPDLLHALEDVGAEITEFVALPPFHSELLSSELERLRRGPSRIFVVHMHSELALRLFERAKEMGMMGKNYVWITTDSFTSLTHSFNVSINSLLEGVIGVKSYFPRSSSRFHDFCLRFSQRFKLKYPEEDNYEPGIFAIQAYDAARTAAQALSEVQKPGHDMLEKIKLTDFQGLGGRVQFRDRKLAPTNTFQIINVIGRSYRELGFWSRKLGFSKNLVENSSGSFLMKDLGQVIWPGGPSDTPSGWVVPTDAIPLRIGVPTGSMFKKYVNVEEDPGKKLSFNGFTIDLFKASLYYLNFYPPYKFFPFNGTYHDLVKQIYLKKFDAAVGDIAIVANRYPYAEFTHPYTEAGLVMIVPSTKNTSNKALLFMKPFTTEMWVLIAIINLYNGFVVWLIERNHSPEEGSMFNQAGNLVCSSFTTLFSLHGNRLHSNLSRMTMVVWLFVALVITQIYTANLTSMLTVPKLEPSILNIETLLSGNALVGYARGSFVRSYLKEVLRFPDENIKNYSTPDDYARALKNKEISAAFLEVPFAKLFLARFCTGFMISGPIYKVGGFGFAFPKGSPLLPRVDEALLKVSEAGKLRELENGMIASETCEDMEEEDRSSSLSPNSFFVLFVFSGGVSTMAFTLYIIHTYKSRLQENIIWRIMIAVMKHWGPCRRQFSRRASDVPKTLPHNSPNATNLQIQV